MLVDFALDWLATWVVEGASVGVMAIGTDVIVGGNVDEGSTIGEVVGEEDGISVGRD